jgi:hypothetical protein
MSMEKFGVDDRDLLDGLRDEEHQLMIQIMETSSPMEKVSYEKMRALEKRLAHVRAKITSIDLKGRTTP